MALFQEKILKKFLVSDEIVSEKFQNYLKYKAKAEEIKTFKEEEFQDGFLRDIFENCLGFTLKSTNPKNFNLEREKKNEKDSKKADGAILIDGKVVGIIELKSYKSKNLDEVARQAFWYLNQNSQANFVIISNFDELRFYINKATKSEKFKLFSLDFEEFKKFYTILSLESIKQNLPLKMQNESQEFEQNITKEFYKIFSKFRNELFENLIKNNENSDKIELLNASSKLCDRFIFMLFAKDRKLLPSDILRKILQQFENQPFDDYDLYDFFKRYFEAINSGNEKLQIQAYNGGLFASDEFLNDLKIDDEILKNNLEKLNSYDFESDISVNILGHIFEQSLSDLEEIESKLNAKNFDKTRSKRKKDGVFYTPNFITTFIVENSLGKLCEDKKEELNLNEILENLKENKEKLAKIEGKKSKIAADERKILELKQEENLQILEKYKTWLLSLKIIDPACGSGAFLNEALEFLIKEHENLKAEMANAGNLFYGENIDISILENNLFGVDINAQAVEIAKLSLWLRTAKKGRKLTKLSDNLKSANSLLEMPFRAETFDIVLGNPPYVRVQTLKTNYEKESKLYEEKYQSATKSYDLYALFCELGFKLLKKNGKLAFILPHRFLITENGSGIREFFLQNRAVEKIIHFGSELVFENVSTYTCLLFLSHENEKLEFAHISPKNLKENLEFHELSYKNLTSENWTLNNPKIQKVLDKISLQPLKVKDVFSKIFVGLQTNIDNIYLLKVDKNKFFSKASNKIIDLEKEILKPILKGDDVSRYCNLENKYFVLFPYILENGKIQAMNEEFIQDNYPQAYKYLSEHQEILKNKKQKDKNNYFLYNFSRNFYDFKQEKIITPYLANKANFTLDKKNFFFNTKCRALIKKEEFQEDYRFYLSIFNSSLMWFFIKNTSSEFSGGYFVFATQFLEPYPLPKLKNLDEEKPFVEKADLMLTLTAKIQNLKQNFLKELESEKIPKKLENFENLTFEEFIKELSKAKKVKFADKLAERNFKQKWQALFENDKKEVLKLQKESLKVDREINSLVYKLYELTDEEITLVENS